MVVASCRNKYDGTNFISAVPTSLLIAPGLRTIQFLFIDHCGLTKQKLQLTFGGKKCLSIGQIVTEGWIM
jgi:hypothetical protein